MTRADLEKRCRSGPDPQAELSETFERFLRLSVADGQASPATLRAYREGAEAFIRFIGSERAATATLDDVEAYRAHLIAEGKTQRTIATRLAAVRALYRAAQRWGLRPDNPAAGVRAPSALEASEDQIMFLPLEGLRRLLALPDTSTPSGTRDRAVLVLMGVHGLRVAEVAALELAALDRQARSSILLVPGKGRKRRRVYLTAETTAVLERWLDLRAQLARPGEAALFLALDRRTRGTALSARALRYRVDEYLERAGLKRSRVSCHSLRHSAATWSLHAGASLQAIAGMLGHSSTRTTETYARLVDRVRSNPARHLWGVLAGEDACD
jgi:site-specific recombinase XerD